MHRCHCERNIMKFRLIVIVLVQLSLCSGCAWFSRPDIEKPAKELVQDGLKAYEKGDYADSIKQFQKLKDWYPFSKFAIMAELKIADAHYHLNEYPEAIQAYEEFEQLHPRNEATPYVVYQIGQCYYEQMDTIDRDQTSAQKALKVFQRLMRQYPGDPYALQAQTHITKCLQSIAGHEFYVGQFYFKSKHYKAALSRFMAVITQYPDVGVQHQALVYIAQCEAIIAQQNKGKASESIN
jgi:outer membrane protein assembly factor BamD